MMDIRELFKSFTSIKIRQLSRAVHTAAHFLAKFCSISNVDAEFFNSFPDRLDGQSNDVC